MSEKDHVSALIARIEDCQDNQSWAYIDYDRSTMRAVKIRMLNQTDEPMGCIITVGQDEQVYTCPPHQACEHPLDFAVTTRKRGLAGFTASLAVIVRH